MYLPTKIPPAGTRPSIPGLSKCNMFECQLDKAKEVLGHVSDPKLRTSVEHYVERRGLLGVIRTVQRSSDPPCPRLRSYLATRPNYLFALVSCLYVC
jgi:hypothetical protein